MSITIENLKEKAMYNPFDIRVDRMTVYGNPYLMSQCYSKDKRAECIGKYKEYFDREVQKKNSKIYKGLQRVLAIYAKHGKLRIFCHCAPQQCHGEIIRQYLLDSIEQYKRDNPKLIKGI